MHPGHSDLTACKKTMATEHWHQIARSKSLITGLEMLSMTQLFACYPCCQHLTPLGADVTDIQQQRFPLYPVEVLQSQLPEAGEHTAQEDEGTALLASFDQLE